MDPKYDHTKYEADIYKMWEQSGAFKPRKASPRAKPFCIIMPPPNANDPLHIGHARFVTIEDLLIRYHRMRGEATLWLPGTDHAGIETQYLFEKRLRDKGESRFDYDRETLYKMIWDYVQENSSSTIEQLKALGASCDWSRLKFTLDPDIIEIVYTTFKKLYDDGLVYRGERMVNYCPRCGTAFSELEVNHVERTDPLYYLDYGTIKIATTRPETIFADVAIAVNPKDKKYSKLVGQKAAIPLIDREIPIIADPLVEKDFGTGALKITPAHDPTDFEIAEKHNLPKLSVIDEEGRMTNTPRKYIGMKAENARKAVSEDLEKAGLLVKTEKIKHTVSTCYKDKGLIEPMISKQWFIKVEPLAKKALEAVEEKKVDIVASKYEKIAKHWLKNLKDWNVSRQIVWGIRIPAFKCNKCQEWTITDGSEPQECTHCGNDSFTQDMDTFDTWFSSGQWPFATLQTTGKNDFKIFYPTSVMETAYDILPFWVIRMIMLGLYVTGEVPFKVVVFHGLVRDSQGDKISKSKGNVINPLEMAEKYGVDALRMSLIWGALIENDISLSEDNIRGQRNFANKLWNVARFTQMKNVSKISAKPKSTNKQDKEILEQLAKTTKKITKQIDTYKLSESAEELYDFVWNSLASKYLESTKSRREEAQNVLCYVLAQTLKLAHPFMPFVTEAIWQELFAESKEDQLLTTSWPGFSSP